MRTFPITYSLGWNISEGMDKRQECAFGEKCYRRNPHHFREYTHPHLLRQNNDSTKDEEQLKIFATIEAEFQKDVQLKRSESQTPSSSTTPTIDTMTNDRINISKKRSISPCPEEKSSQTKKRTIDTEVGDRKKSKIQIKLEAGAPYNFFLTKVKDCPETHNAQDSLYMTDLLHPR